jgi:DNA-binding response OmpR family regulator
VLFLDRPEVNLGRALENHIVLTDERASRRHARIVWKAGAYWIEDLGSRNGTQVGGRRLESPQRLDAGDVVVIGATVLAFQMASAADTLVDQEVAELQVDDSTARVLLMGKPLNVTAKEFRALSLLYKKRGSICSKDELAQHVWPEYEGNVGNYSIEQLVSRLRRKLEAEDRGGRRLVTVRGLGYRLIIT